VTEPAHAGEVLRSSAAISAATLVARVLGFARWIVLALTVGTTYLGNTYQTANWVPNILFDLSAGGVLSAVFVPTFVAELEVGRDRGVEVASGLANAFLLISVPIVVAGILFARPIMSALTLGVADPAVRAEEIRVGAWFLRFFIPQVPLYLAGIVMTGVLHAHRRFLAPAIAPALSSLVVIATYLAFHALGPGAELGSIGQAQKLVLALGTTAGVAVLAFCQLPAVLRLGVGWRPVLPLADPAVRRAIRAGGYGLAYFAVSEVGLVVTLVLANRVRGGVVAYQVAFAFYELPNALAGLPVAVSLFPSLSLRALREDLAGFGELLSSGWRFAALVVTPAAAGLAVLAPPLARAALGYAGAQAAPELVASTLRTLTLGLPAYALSATIVRSFYARRETAFPVVINSLAVGVFAMAALAATMAASSSGSRALGALGAAHAAGQWVALLAGALLLHRRAHRWAAGHDLGFLAACIARAAIMAAAVHLIGRALSESPAALAAAAGIAAGLLVYALLVLVDPSARRALAVVRRR
jgi:putative peptidoglycan lipid II flippase